MIMLFLRELKSSLSIEDEKTEYAEIKPSH